MLFTNIDYKLYIRIIYVTIVFSYHSISIMTVVFKVRTSYVVRTCVQTFCIRISSNQQQLIVLTNMYLELFCLCIQGTLID